MNYKKSKEKSMGQVFTPPYIVDEILDICSYKDEHIIKKHIIDNSCGNGAFLVNIVKRYCEQSIKMGFNNSIIKEHLETYIHGIDNDIVAYEDCLGNLNKVASSYGIYGVVWDLHNKSSLSMKEFDKKMDFVVGNPPYIRVHNLDDTYNEVKQYKFANGGMTDLYLVFFELGFNMLNSKGKLCYITPSSWLNSLAASNMRLHILNHKNLVSLVDLGHHQPFKKITAYTMISFFSNEKHDSSFDYYTFNGKSLQKEFVANLTLEECFIDSYFYLSDKDKLKELREIKTAPLGKFVSVKNGFATLADDVFIGDNIPESPFTIRVLKASTGKWYKCLYPYNKKGKPLPKDVVFSDKQVAYYLNEHKEELLKGKKEYPGWYEFGRTQALLDVSRKKLAINCLCRTEKDIKAEIVKEGEGLYSGLYIITDYSISFNEIKDIIISPNFIDYVRLLKKYKSGGYYTYNTKDVEQYVNYYLTYKTNKKYDKPGVSQQSLALF